MEASIEVIRYRLRFRTVGLAGISNSLHSFFLLAPGVCSSPVQAERTATFLCTNVLGIAYPDTYLSN